MSFSTKLYDEFNLHTVDWATSNDTTKQQILDASMYRNIFEQKGLKAAQTHANRSLENIGELFPKTKEDALPKRVKAVRDMAQWVMKQKA